MRPMFNGAQAILSSDDAEATRAAALPKGGQPGPVQAGSRGVSGCRQSNRRHVASGRRL
jgi:hypothetical protein